jgi:hypothetical protein
VLRGTLSLKNRCSRIWRGWYGTCVLMLAPIGKGALSHPQPFAWLPCRCDTSEMDCSCLLQPQVFRHQPPHLFRIAIAETDQTGIDISKEQAPLPPKLLHKQSPIIHFSNPSTEQCQHSKPSINKPPYSSQLYSF